MRRLTWLLTTLIFVLFCSSSAIAGEQNVIVNGDFSNGLDAWTFEDGRATYSGRAAQGKTAYSEVEIMEGMARLHSYAAYGEGFFRQLFDQPQQPLEIGFYYSLEGDPCGRAGFRLMNGDEYVLAYSTTKDQSPRKEAPK
jgi:hypothetical protein